MAVATDAQTGIGGWIVLALMLPGVIIILGVVIACIVRKRPASPDAASPEAAGYWRVLGVDAQTGQKRESIFHAASRQSAEGRAQLEGIVVTEIELVPEPSDA